MPSIADIRSFKHSLRKSQERQDIWRWDVKTNLLSNLLFTVLLIFTDRASLPRELGSWGRGNSLVQLALRVYERSHLGAVGGKGFKT